MDIDASSQDDPQEQLPVVPAPSIVYARTNSLAMAAFPWVNGTILTSGHLTDVVDTDQLSIVSH